MRTSLVRVRVVAILLGLMLLAACGAAARNDESVAPSSGAADSDIAFDAVGEEAPAEAPMPVAQERGEGAPGTTGGNVQVQVERRIIYNGSLQIRVDDPRAVAESLRGLAQRYGGYVSNADIYEIGEKHYRASVQLRIAAEQFDAAMNELRGLATEVLNESIDTQDVTDQYVDLEARIENLERTEEELQILLTEARENRGETEDILAVYRELTNIRGQIESLQGQLNLLADRVALATINVELIPPEAQVEIVNEGWSITRTIRQALRNLTEGLQWVVDLAIYVAIAVLPILLIFAIALYIVFRIVRWIYRRLRGPRDAAPATPSPPAEPTVE